MDALGMIALGLAKQAKGEAEEKSTVVANPVLEGTEDALTGLEVDGVKYSAGGGKKYFHNIYINTGFNGSGYDGDVANIMCSVVTDSSTPFTKTTFAKWLYDNGYNSYDENKMYPAIGTGMTAENYGTGRKFIYFYSGVCSSDGTSFGSRNHYAVFGSNNLFSTMVKSNNSLSGNSYNFRDKVLEI